jgi:hypothetical protein
VHSSYAHRTQNLSIKTDVVFLDGPHFSRTPKDTLSLFSHSHFHFHRRRGDSATLRTFLRVEDPRPWHLRAPKHPVESICPPRTTSSSSSSSSRVSGICHGICIYEQNDTKLEAKLKFFSIGSFIGLSTGLNFCESGYSFGFGGGHTPLLPLSRVILLSFRQLDNNTAASDSRRPL